MELREAGSEFAKVLGTDAARALVMAVAALSGYTLGNVASWVRSLPSYEFAQAQWMAQGADGSLSQTLVQVVEVEVETVEQVILGNGQRWHLPRGKWLNDIPMQDPLGDELQAAADRLVQEWGPNELSAAERKVIHDAIQRGNYRSAAHLEGLARGRWVHRKMERLFSQLNWNAKGVDAVDPVSGIKYEVLSGTAENFGVHGRRMATELYRMISF